MGGTCRPLATNQLVQSVSFNKGKEVDLYSAYRQYNSTTKLSDVDHTELPAFPSYKHSLEGGTAANGVTHLTTDILLIPHPTEGRRLSLPGWLTHSRHLTHVVAHQP